MTDEKLVQNVAPETAQPNHTSDNTEHALFGKIARLPDEVRSELNQRIFDGQGGREILAWLNELPAVKKILDSHFKSVPVNHENLSNWRHGGYKRWYQEKQDVGETQKLGELAQKLTEADGGRFAPAAAAVASGKIFQFLKAASADQTDPDNIVKCASAASDLLQGEQNYTRLELARERLRQKDDQLILMRDRNQRDFVVHVLRFLNDARAKEIASSSLNYDAKIEVLGIHIFDEMWEPRPVSESMPSEVHLASSLPALNQES